MSETEEFAAGARLNRRIVEDLIRQARALRDKAERLEKESDQLRAAAARELADYLEGAAAEWLG